MQSYLLSHPTLLGVFEQPRQGVSVMPGPVVDLEKVSYKHTHTHLELMQSRIHTVL